MSRPSLTSSARLSSARWGLQPDVEEVRLGHGGSGDSFYPNGPYHGVPSDPAIAGEEHIGPGANGGGDVKGVNGPQREVLLQVRSDVDKFIVNAQDLDSTPGEEPIHGFELESIGSTLPKLLVYLFGRSSARGKGTHVLSQRTPRLVEIRELNPEFDADDPCGQGRVELDGTVLDMGGDGERFGHGVSRSPSRIHAPGVRMWGNRTDRPLPSARMTRPGRLPAMLRGVIFDFDGVLVDSERAHFEGFRVVLAERAGLEITFHEYTEHYLACDDHSGMRRALELHGQAASPTLVDELAIRKKAVFAELLPRISLLPGARDLILALHEEGVPLAIASGSRRHEIEIQLESHDLLKVFRGIVSADDVDNFKPHPEPYLRGRAVIGAGESAAGVVAFEDSTTGMAAACAANLRVIGVANSHPRDKLGLAHRVVDSLEELTVEDVTEVATGAV